MKKKDRPDVTSDLETWKSNIDARSKTSLVRELFKRRELPPVFRVDPDNESEVIALFVSMLDHRLIMGYKIQALSGYQRYDSLTDIDTISSGVASLEDSLSVRNKDGKTDGPAKVLEFKYSFEDLLQDFEDKNKNPVEIDFVVCWTVPDLNVRRGRLQPTYGEWRDSRTLYAGSYIWFDENDSTEIPVVSLMHVVAELLAREEAKLGETGLGKATLVQLERQDKEALV
jgi:hypothetical protein